MTISTLVSFAPVVMKIAVIPSSDETTPSPFQENPMSVFWLNLIVTDWSVLM